MRRWHDSPAETLIICVCVKILWTRARRAWLHGSTHRIRYKVQNHSSVSLVGRHFLSSCSQMRRRTFHYLVKKSIQLKGYRMTSYVSHISLFQAEQYVCYSGSVVFNLFLLNIHIHLNFYWQWGGFSHRTWSFWRKRHNSKYYAIPISGKSCTCWYLSVGFSGWITRYSLSRLFSVTKLAHCNRQLEMQLLMLGQRAWRFITKG